MDKTRIQYAAGCLGVLFVLLVWAIMVLLFAKGVVT